MEKETIKIKRQDFHLAKYCLDKGHSITVHYGDYDDAECVKSKDYDQIKESANAICDEYHMVIYDNDNRRLGWAFIVYGNEDHELVADYTENEFMDEWWASYQKEFGEEI